MRAAVLVLVLASSSLALAKPMKIGIDMGNGTLILTFDPKKVSEADLRAWADLAPQASQGLTTDTLSSCRDQAGAVTACGAKPYTPALPEFFRAGELTVTANRDRVRAVTDRKVPRQLEPAKEWLRRQTAFFAGLEERKLAYFKSWKTADLTGPIEGIDGAKTCAPIVAKLDAATSQDEKYKLTRFEWHNCMVERAHTVMKDFPTAPWKAFLKAYRVKAKFEQETGD
ncbi:MAG: hypothetical protein ACKV2T_32120 [Kofleriaceae bacterium]